MVQVTAFSELKLDFRDLNSVLAELVDVFAVRTVAELWIAVETLLKAYAIILFASISFAVAALSNQLTFFDLLYLFLTTDFSLRRVKIGAVTTRTIERITLDPSLEADAVLLGALAILAGARLLIIGKKLDVLR